jgi:uncharacterized membrane protein
MPSANRRLLASGVAGVVVAIALGFVVAWQVAALAGWCSGAAAFLGQVMRGVRGLDAEGTRAIATQEDPSHLVADAALIVAAAASLVGVGFVLAKAGESSGTTKGLTAALGALSVMLAWTTLQTIFTLRYARLFYEEAVGGIDFGADPVDGLPDYHDFAYLAFTVGMTYQVSDTAIRSRAIRRTVLRHSLLSFVFATAFIAVLINLVGGLL